MIKIPKYIAEIMQRAEYNFDFFTKHPEYSVGYTVNIRKYSYYETAQRFREEIEKLKAWVGKNGGEAIIIHTPNKTEHKNMQYATITIYDPIMKYIEQYIRR